MTERRTAGRRGRRSDDYLRVGLTTSAGLLVVLVGVLLYQIAMLRSDIVAEREMRVIELRDMRDDYKRRVDDSFSSMLDVMDRHESGHE